MFKNLFCVVLFFFIFIVNVCADVDTNTIYNAKVLSIIDGDTILVSTKNGNKKVRLIGIQAPELNSQPIWPFAKESKQALQSALQGQKVNIIHLSLHKTDKYNRILADIYRTKDNLWLNGYLVEQGLAYVYILNSNKIPKIKELIALENKAIQNKLPFWQNPKYVVISVSEAEKNINNYKIIEGKVLSVVKTKKSIWLQFEESGNQGFSARIDNNNLVQFVGKKDPQALIGKNVRLRGFIEKYSPKFGSFINLQSLDSLETL